LRVLEIGPVDHSLNTCDKGVDCGVLQRSFAEEWLVASCRVDW